MARNIVTITCTSLLLAGCAGQQGSSMPGLGRSSGTITWSASAQNQKHLPGIDQASIYHEGTAFVVWSDFDQGGGGSSSGNVHGVKGQGRLMSRDNRHAEFHFETKDGRTGLVTINEVNYDLENGGLFLVSANGDQVQVKQLKRDMRNLTFERESLEAFARNDPDILAFFARNARKE